MKQIRLDGVDDEFYITFTAPVEKRFNLIQDDDAGPMLLQLALGLKHPVISLNFSIRYLSFLLQILAGYKYAD